MLANEAPGLTLFHVCPGRVSRPTAGTSNRESVTATRKKLSLGTPLLNQQLCLQPLPATHTFTANGAGTGPSRAGESCPYGGQLGMDPR